MIESSDSPELRTVSTNDRCCESIDVSRSISVRPSTPFIGVRISWLMFARNSDLALLAASADSLAERRSCSLLRKASSACARLVVSKKTV